MSIITATVGTSWSAIRRRRDGAVTPNVHVFRAFGGRFLTALGSSLRIDGADLDLSAARLIQ